MPEVTGFLVDYFFFKKFVASTRPPGYPGYLLGFTAGHQQQSSRPSARRPPPQRAYKKGRHIKGYCYYYTLSVYQ